MGEHLTSGLPTQPGGQVHLALWLLTLQVAEAAQGFSYRQGLRHLLPIQAELWEQSWLILHSTLTQLV